MAEKSQTQQTKLDDSIELAALKGELPKSTDDVRTLVAKFAAVVEENQMLSAEVLRLEQIITARKASDEQLAKARTDEDVKRGLLPYALVPMIGDGRREVKIGDQITPTEMAGFVEGKHYALRAPQR